MTLTAKDVEEITRLLEQSGFDELELEMDGVKLSLRRSGAGEAPSPLPLSRTRERGEEKRTARRPAEDADPALHDVAAPLLGTFYRAPKPGAPPFVDTGAAVEEDTIVGIIEVMKLMNTVRAGVRGTIEQILAQDGTLVEYGEALLRVRRA